MGVVKNRNKKTKSKDEKKNVDSKKQKKDEGRTKKKKRVSCLQCLKSPDDGGLEGKYRVAAPELMQDTFMSDSEDEGGEVECPIQQQQQYRYMNSEAGTLNRARPLEDSVTDGHLWPSNNDSRVATIERQPLDIGFLVSFVVDARGGAMKAKRRGGVRIIVPPAACAAPTRVTCRAATRRAPVAAPPPLMEGEALASRLLELQPQGAKFLGPVIIEVPIFTASCPEREIVILRSDTGETWQDHYLHNNDNPMIQEALTRERQDYGNSGESLGESGERVTRIITCDFPHYLAVVSRVRQEVHIIGPEGGTISSAHIPQVQALFPPQALTKRIRVGLQAHGANNTLCRRVLPRHAAVSPVLTVEPRRRKFHRSITLTAPLPHPADQKINSHDKQSTANLRLLCSIMGGQARAVWEDVTGSTPLTITDDCASFTTTVSARFWLMNCQNVSDATKLATELYREMLLVPFEVRIVVLGKRLDALEGRLLVLYITDRYAYDTLLHQEHYTEVAHSTSVRFLDSKPVYLEFSGNLVPVTKSGTQPTFLFEAFKDNRVEFTVRVKHHEESPSGRIYFMNEPKVAKGEQSPNPACVLDVSLPERIAPRAAKSHLDCLNLDQSGFDALKDELSFHWGDHNHSINPPAIPEDEPLQLNGHGKTIANGDVKYPTKDTEEKETKPHLNGDTLHVDSNKTKATFDSDEDKTPMNTLEKGKKKSEGGSFLGGLADKVKNVFSHSDDKDQGSKESSPKPQAKPRESKEKTPPKPTPRIINEDILEKVEDMFKDVRQKPHIKDDDDLNSKVYATKLIVDEDPKDLRVTTEEVYHQYQHMQPVETPLHCKTTDPFQFYDDCCKGKYKTGEKHSHEETSNLADRIEQVKFTTHEKIQEVADVAEGDLQNAINKAKNENDNIKQQANEVREDIIVKSENIKNDLISKEEKIKLDFKDNAEKLNNVVDEKLDDTLESVHKVQKDLTDDAVDLHSKISHTFNNLPTHLDNSKEKLTDKSHLVDFATIERGEQLKLSGQDKISQLGKSFDRTADDISNKTEDSTNSISSKIHNLKMDVESEVENIQNTVIEKTRDTKENINIEFNNVKIETEKTVENVKQATSEKLNEVNESVEVVKEKGKKAKSKAEKKSKEGKNFFTGLVHNIFGEKEKVEDEVKAKIAEGKKSAKEVSRQASEAKDDLEKSIAEENEKVRQKTEKFLQSAKYDKDVLVKNFHDKSNDIVQNSKEIVNGVQTTKDKLLKSGQEKTLAFAAEVENKKDELLQSAQDTKEKIAEGVQDATDKLVQSSENSMEKLIKDVEDNKEQLVQNARGTTENAVTIIQDKGDEFVQNSQDVSDNAINYIQDKKNEFIENSKQTVQFAQVKTEELLENAKNNKNEIVNGAQNKKNTLLQNTQEIFKNIQDKKNEVVHTAEDTTEKVIISIDDKKNELVTNAQIITEDVAKAAQDKKDKLAQIADKKREEIVQNVQVKSNEQLQKIEDKKNEEEQKVQDTINQLEDFLHNEKNEIGAAVHHKVDQADKALKNTKESVKTAITDKKKELSNIKNSVQFQAEDRLSRIRQEAEQATEDIKRTAEETINAASEKKSQVEAKITNKVGDIKDLGKEELQQVQNLASEKGSELQRSAKESFIHVQDSASSAFEQFESAATDKVNDAKDTCEDLHSSARDTFADLKDDVQGLESSAQDTLHSFQSSAGNTFDSLDESAREFLSGAQNTAARTDENAKELFGNVQDSFEGFQIAAGNKLEDIKGSAKDRLEEADERLEHTKETLKENVTETEEAVADSLSNEADKFTSSLNDLGNSVFGISGKGFMKDSSTKLLESEKSQSSPHKKSSGIPKLKRKNKK